MIFGKSVALAAVLVTSLFAGELTPKLVLPKTPEPVHGPDSNVKPGVPQGKVTDFIFADSKVFVGTKRRIHLYVPAQYDPKKETALMVFQDGHAYVNPKGDYRATIVFDNLIASGDMPPVIGIFIDPGHKGDAKPVAPWKNNNRSFEYDTLSADYATFLIDEILPLIGKDYNLTKDPEKRAICGASSGGICAWTVAWQRPDAFRKVVSSIGSFTNIRGGDAYPGMMRKTENKPIRGFFQDGINDLDNEHGNWPLGNMAMEAALKFKKYDYKYVWGEGGHNGKHMGAILPEAMRWIWRK
jgi:enterochelin esterase-like enzyme